MKKTVPIIGFLILTAMVLFLYGGSTYTAWTTQVVGGIVMTIVLAGLVYKLVCEAKELPKAKMDGLFAKKNILNFLTVVIAALLTRFIAVDLGHKAVIASGLVQILAALIFPAYGAPAASGSFVGMASCTLLAGYGEMTLAGIVAGVIFVLTSAVFGGFGGKLGTIAVCGCVVGGLLIGGQIGQGTVPGWDVGLLIVITAVVAAVVTNWLNHELKHGAVMASGIVALVAGLALPVLVPEIGYTLAVVAICASFVGMSNRKRLPNLRVMAIAGLIVGLTFVYSAPYLGGAGGKLGTLSFGAGIAVSGYLGLLGKLGGEKK